MRRGKKSVLLYWTFAALFALVLTWWLIFFSRQGELMLVRLSESGVALTPEQMEAVRQASDRTLRMFVSEGAFLALLAIGGLLLVLRSLKREVEMHRRQRDFLSAITHELRSPIAAARLQVESVKLGRVPEAKRERYLGRTLDDLDRLNRTVDQLLTAARASSGRVQLAPQSLDLAEFARRIVERVAGIEGPHGAELEVVAPEVVRVRADAEALDTIVHNLVSNALKYGGDPPRVRVEVQRDGDEAILQVCDHGPGLPAHGAARLFDPFVRGGSEMVRSRPGVGLGLYLVSELTRALGGSIRATNGQEGGLAMRVALPLAPRIEGGAA